MKISMMTYTMARGLKPGETFDVKSLCEFTRELGLEAVDWVSIYGHDPKEVRKIMDDYGLVTCCYTKRPELIFPTAAERAAGRDEFKKGVDTAVILGADKVMHPIPGNDKFTREENFRYYVEGIREVIDYADQAGVTITVENFPMATSPFVGSADVNRLVAEIPQMRITYDNGNCTTCGESTYDGFKNSAQWIVHAHFKDFRAADDGEWGPLGLDGKTRCGTLVGDGDVDQIGGLRAMKECGYTGYINFEYEGNEMTPRNATIEGVRRMRQWMAELGVEA